MSVTALDLNPIFDYPTLSDHGENLLRRIANQFQANPFDSPDQATLMMDGVQFMMQRSLSTMCKTDLTAPLPPLDDEAHDPPSFQKCRKCAEEYVVKLRDGGFVTIVAGMPKPDSAYKTMSYVWGPHPERPLSVPCVSCGHVTLVPMINNQRFRNLTELGGSGNTVWIDAISINQYDKDDVAAHVVAMGHIYRNAKCVSVLLPISDKPAFDCLVEIKKNARLILLHYRNFIDNSDFTITDPDTGETFHALTEICQLFLKNLQNLSDHLHRFSYWSRAWTFQEWALARDLEIALEGGSADSCFNLKSLVLGAAMLISRYKILQHQYAEIKLGEGITHGRVPPIFESIKALFPDEDLFLSAEEIDPKEVSFQANFPHFGISHLLGIRSVPPLPSSHQVDTPQSIDTSDTRPDDLAKLRARLKLLLSAFAASRRQATHEADLIACWASMCNVRYAYDRHDDFRSALKKVSEALRSQGIIMYNFLPDTKGGLRTPAELFNVYVRYHPQLNATNEAELPGAPIFTGRADTVSHMVFSLDNISLPTQWYDDANGTRQQLRKIAGAKIEQVANLDGNLEDIMSTFASKAIYGEQFDTINAMFWPVDNVALQYLEKLPSERLSIAKLVVVNVPFYKDIVQGTAPHHLYLWAVLPIDIVEDELSVCRELTHGVLVLNVERMGTTHIAAYLTLSDHFSGTFLVKTDDDGVIDMSLKIPERGDIQFSIFRQISLRRLNGKVYFE
ncbi:hypothetical protein CVT26_011272 [Gymnopilus dilepis]|uniref:Heterokaryon incompatibility domain-containing protein n=1 Tax=Gymnopilus dilepis TaxID=231916 RepID=A0A409VJF4_9AGAR|nr:hypothetical protein CVT26_011272 [Gymnopilus dilepis]